MKRVLMIAGQMHVGGLENMVMNFLRYGDRENIRFDFMVNYAEEKYYNEEIRSYGGKIYVMPRLKPKNIIKYPLALIKFFREHKGEYDVVHGNLTSVGVFYLPIAKHIGKVKKTIIHAHYTSTKENHYEKLERLMLFPLRFLADYYFACSDMAGEFCYGKRMISRANYRMIHNGVDCGKFEYNPEVRAAKRRELGLGDEFVLLNVGRLYEQKNQRFLLEIVAEMKRRGSAVKVLIAGEGELLEELEQIARDKDISDCVEFLGLRSDVAELMQAADAFILTSLFEGLPVTGIEAQAAGLPCIFTDTITRELDILETAQFVPLGHTDEWVDAVERVKGVPRVSTTEQMQAAGYDIRRVAAEMSEFYKS